MKGEERGGREKEMRRGRGRRGGMRKGKWRERSKWRERGEGGGEKRIRVIESK